MASSAKYRREEWTILMWQLVRHRFSHHSFWVSNWYLRLKCIRTNDTTLVWPFTIGGPFNNYSANWTIPFRTSITMRIVISSFDRFTALSSIYFSRVDYGTLVWRCHRRILCSKKSIHSTWIHTGLVQHINGKRPWLIARRSIAESSLNAIDGLIMSINSIPERWCEKNRSVIWTPMATESNETVR